MQLLSSQRSVDGEGEGERDKRRLSVWESSCLPGGPSSYETNKVYC